MTRAARDAHGRLLPGSVPGWGMSWWWHEQGLDPVDTSGLTPEETMQTVFRYWDAVNEGWWPAVPEDEWVGPHHPFAAHDEVRIPRRQARMPMRLALAVGMPLTIALGVVSAHYDWSIGAVYAAFAVICALMVIIADVQDRRRR